MKKLTKKRNDGCAALSAKMLKDFRESKGLTKSQASRLFDITPPHYQNLEDGKCRPSVKVLRIMQMKDLDISSIIKSAE